MKKLLLATWVLAVSFAVIAAPRRVVLVVQNHTSDVSTLPMAALADTLSSRLSGQTFRIINPHNVIGVNQNRTANGETMPEASAQELGRMMNADGVITAAIQEFTSEDIGTVGRKLKVRLALNLVDAATGDTICGVDSVELSKNYTTAQVKADTATLCESLMHGAAAKSAERLLTRVSTVNWDPGEIKLLNVFFGCNVLGADVQIDGQSYGTCPAQIALTPGSHSLVVSYPPYYYEFKRRAIFNQDGQTYKVVLQITPEGEVQRERAIEYENKLLALNNARRDGDFEYEKKKRLLDVEIEENCGLFHKQMEFADALLNRYDLSGEADDYVRKTIAEGTAVYWKNSFGRIAITDGFADNVAFATPEAKTGDLTDSPSSSDIGRSLQNLLMNRTTR